MAAGLAEPRGDLHELDALMADTCAVILGMHRSGTSALAGVLNILGVDFGDDLIGPSASNEKGHFESTRAMEFNDSVLRRFRSRWKRSFRLPSDWASTLDGELVAFGRSLAIPEAAVWGLKDPRICRLVPVWREILRSRGVASRFILCLRQPEEVCASLACRDELESERSHALWIEHVCAAEADTRGQPRIILTFDQLLANPGQTARELARFLGLPDPDAPALASVNAFLEPQLRHERATAGRRGLAARLYELAASGEAAELPALVDDALELQRFREDCVRTESPAARRWRILR